MSTINPIICILCNHEAVRTYSGLHGYIEGKTYDVYECTFCKTSFCPPLAVDENLYDILYKQGKRAPGYARYYRYAELAESSKDPLTVLSNQDGIYWSVREALMKLGDSSKQNTRILEVGCGLGYLTYALRMSGYTQAFGTDISTHSVEEAKKRFGDFYFQGDIFTLPSTETEKYNIVIMTELIEHIPDPRAFLEAVKKHLAPGGKIIITTPNKDHAPVDMFWQSDAPPVHLWWIGKRGMEVLASNLSMSCSFVDYLPFMQKFYFPIGLTKMSEFQSGFPRLKEDGTNLTLSPEQNLKSKLFSAKMRYWLSYVRRRWKTKRTDVEFSTLTAVFSL